MIVCHWPLWFRDFWVGLEIFDYFLQVAVIQVVVVILVFFLSVEDVMDVGYNTLNSVVIAKFEKGVLGFCAILECSHHKARVKIFDKFSTKLVQHLLKPFIMLGHRASLLSLRSFCI